ncbi:diguanylate cyclase [Spirochaetia bacterium 38H-sp]|uniref:diguanylate cyclase n=1 Tax=Rarispira pelagica TaxID=3141764 RepID=A0ABU9UD04_9SPIR
MLLERIKILYIEDDDEDIILIKKLLEREPSFKSRLYNASSIEEGEALILEKNPDVIILDLNLPDASGLAGLKTIIEGFPNIPVIVMTGFDDDNTGDDAVRAGAQDYLVKGKFTSGELVKTIRYSIQRFSLYKKIQELAIEDPLTGLLNRRGFEIHFNAQRRIARRRGEILSIFFMDMDNLKVINDTYGHSEGDRALKLIAGVLQRVFRDSDFIARFGGDEFIIMTVGRDMSKTDSKINTLRVELHKESAKRGFHIPVEVSAGIAICRPEDDMDLDSLVKAADSSMYNDKKIRKKMKSVRERDK